MNVINFGMLSSVSRRCTVGAVPTSIIGIVMEIIQMHPDLLTPSLPGGNEFKFKQTALDDAGNNSKSENYYQKVIVDYCDSSLVTKISVAFFQFFLYIQFLISSFTVIWKNLVLCCGLNQYVLS